MESDLTKNQSLHLTLPVAQTNFPYQSHYRSDTQDVAVEYTKEKMLITRVLSISLVAATMAFTACGKRDTADSLSTELATKIDEISSVIETVKDKESAEEAAERIRQIGNEFVSIAKRLDALGELSEDDRKLVADRMTKAMRAMNEKRQESLQSAGSVEAALILGKGIEEFGERAKEVEAILKRISSQ